MNFQYNPSGGTLIILTILTCKKRQFKNTICKNLQVRRLKELSSINRNSHILKMFKNQRLP